MTRRRLPPLATLRAFEAAGGLSSFKQAAGELAVTATAISHQIRALELWLGCSLFERRARRVELTAAGRELLPVVRDGFDALAAAIDRVQHADRGPSVTVSTTRAFAAEWLLPRLPSLQAQHQAIDLRISATDEVVDLASGAVDIAIRYARSGRFAGLDAALVARELEQGMLEVPFSLSLRAPSYYLVWSKSKGLTRAAEAVKRWILVEARRSAVSTGTA